jgi:hypothetical protein
LRQVGHLGEDYEEWVHQPIMRKESPRFFHSSFLEVPKTPSFKIGGVKSSLSQNRGGKTALKPSFKNIPLKNDFYEKILRIISHFRYF